MIGPDEAIETVAHLCTPAEIDPGECKGVSGLLRRSLDDREPDGRGGTALRGGRRGARHAVERDMELGPDPLRLRPRHIGDRYAQIRWIAFRVAETLRNPLLQQARSRRP